MFLDLMHAMQPVAKISSPYSQKFGVPRQGKLARLVRSFIVFEPEFRQRECLRGLEGFSHVWLIWRFHLNGDVWHPTVRPPRLGGNVRMGVFASRSPFRPNSLGLSLVRIEALHLEDAKGAFIEVSGADLVNGTPIYDIKPYVPYADYAPDARAGFACGEEGPRLELHYDETCVLPAGLTPAYLAAMEEALSLDPRPAYHEDAQRVYFFEFLPYEISFRVQDNILHVLAIKGPL